MRNSDSADHKLTARTVEQVNYFPSRFDPVRHAERYPGNPAQLSGRREKRMIPKENNFKQARRLSVRPLPELLYRIQHWMHHSYFRKCWTSVLLGFSSSCCISGSS